MSINSHVDLIKAAIDPIKFYESLIGSPLKQVGTRYVCRCPFHTESTPSLYIFPETGRWQCFGACATGGDVLDFYCKLKNVTVAESLPDLAKIAGIELPKRNRTEDARTLRIIEAMNAAADIYLDNLRHKEGRDAFKYLSEKRGISVDTIKQFRLGYALNEWQALSNELQTKTDAHDAFTQDELIDAGFSVRGKKAENQHKIYDKFRNRLMIPIMDAAGRIVGFGGRAMDNEVKYINTSQTAAFTKGALLFGLNFAKAEMRKTGSAIVVEGYMDAIQSHQSGFTNTVAQMGTALSDDQVRQLANHATRLVLALDPDSAGSKATLREIDIAAQMAQADRFAIDLRIIKSPTNQDPDEIIRANPELWRSIVNEAVPAADYVIDAGVAALPEKPSAQDKEHLARKVLPVLTATESDFSRNTNMQQLADRLRIPLDTLITWSKQEQKKPATTKQAEPEKPDRLPIEYNFLSMLLANPRNLTWLSRSLRERHIEPVQSDDFWNPSCRIIFTTVLQALNQDDYDVPEYMALNVPEFVRSEYDKLVNQKGSPDQLINCGYRIKEASLRRTNLELQGIETSLDAFTKNMRAIHRLRQLTR